MGFNFEGMMQGVGAGLVNYGEILKEQDKQEWDNQQALLKYEREERLKKLEISANKENTQNQLTSAETIAANKLKVDQQQADSQSTYQGKLGDAATANAAAETKKVELSEGLQEANKALIQAQANSLNATAAGTKATTQQIADLDAATQKYAEIAFPNDPERQVIFAYQMKYGKKTDESKPLSPDIVTQAMKQAEAQADTIEVNSTEWKKVKNQLATQKGSEPSDVEVRNAIVTSLTSIKISQLEKDLGVSQSGVLGGSGTKKAETPSGTKTWDPAVDEQFVLSVLKTGDPAKIDELKKAIAASGDPKAIESLTRNAKTINYDLTRTATPEEQSKATTQPEVLNPEDPLGNKPGVAAWRAANNKTAANQPISNGKPNLPAASTVLNVPEGASVVMTPEQQRKLAMSKFMYNGPYASLSAAKKAQVDAEVAKMNGGK